VSCIPQPVPVASDPITDWEAKARLGFEPDDLLMGSFGYVAPSKRVDVALRAFARVRRSFPNAHYAIVGRVIAGHELSPLLDELGLGEEVRLVGYADDAIFRTYLRAVDVGVNLRYPTHGETSATLLALMAAGKPVLVSRVDAFVELPDAACVKIDVGTEEQSQIETWLLALLEDRDRRCQIGRNALSYVRRECDPEAVAARYVDFMQQVLNEV
jgi:glycosyltransferase involved in cell wall biosynthesis